MTQDDLYKAWHSVGADIAGLNFSDFVSYLPAQRPSLRDIKPLTDEMIVAGGKALAKLHAESCGLDFDDVWKYYGEDHKSDAKAAIEAAHSIKSGTNVKE